MKAESRIMENRSFINSIMSVIPGIRHSLSLQLLTLTLTVIFATELVIMVPSVAHQHFNWLRTRTQAAYLVEVALEDTANHKGQHNAASVKDVNDMLVVKVLNSADILGITIKSGDDYDTIISPDITNEENQFFYSIDLENYSTLNMIADAWGNVFSNDKSLLRVSGRSELRDNHIVEIIVSREDLRMDLRNYARNILGLSLVISLIAAVFVYWTLNNLIIKPVRNMRENMSLFTADPEDANNILVAGNRIDEIGDAQRDLNGLENRLYTLLKEQKRLAALGAGISKISHDLRNILASAQLMSDRLVSSDDPRVRKLSPRLIDALDRAITLSRETLNYGKISPEILNLETINLEKLVDDVFEDTASMYVDMQNNIPKDLKIKLDRVQIHRGLTNIIRNGVEALTSHIENDTPPPKKPDQFIIVNAKHEDNNIIVEIVDNGPGLPDAAKEFLHEPFKGSFKPGGSGLGVAITTEIMRAHGGDLILKKSDATGATFNIILPA